MTKNRKIVQFSLVLIGIILIFATYFIYPELKKNKEITKKIEKEKKVEKEFKEEVSNAFQNVSYNALYNFENPFTVSSENAVIYKKDSNVVFMDYMKVTVSMKDGRTITITSDKGKYNKITYDCYFENNVKATDGKTVINADNLDFLANEDFATIYNNVVLLNDRISLKADKVHYDFQKKYYKISMFNEENVKVKLIQ